MSGFTGRENNNELSLGHMEFMYLEQQSRGVNKLTFTDQI